MKMEEIRTLASQVDGWLAPEEEISLYRLARSCQGRGVIVEIGSWQGKSTIWLGKGSQDGAQSKVYAIDPHTGASEHQALFGEVWTFDQFKSNIEKAQLNDVVIPIVKTSMEAVKDFELPVELIFIDGAHEYEYVSKDFQAWYPKVIENGIIAFHDSTRSEGVARVVEKWIFKSTKFRDVHLVHSITYAQKVSRNSLRDRLRNRYVLLLKKFYELTTRVTLPLGLRQVGKLLYGRIQ